MSKRAEIENKEEPSPKKQKISDDTDCTTGKETESKAETKATTQNTNETESKTETKKKQLPKRKIAFLLGYCGLGYQGMQM